MNKLKEYSYMWESERAKYVLVRDEFGDSIFHLRGNEQMFFIIEDEVLMKLIIKKMIECGNKVYKSIKELRENVATKLIT